jgi:hypothetical protein
MRCRQLEAMFDVPPQDRATLSWSGDLPIENGDWRVGLIVGPSGCGKSTIARQIFNSAYDVPMKWGADSVIDDFEEHHTVADISAVCSAVGFNTVPAWFRPYAVLSTGEKFRVDLARRMLSLPDPVVVDEFTSVVDRQVAKIGALAVQKYVRRHNRRFVAVSCHYDIIDWLQPDWVFEPATMAFKPRGCLQRPSIEIEIRRVKHDNWRVFAPFHYLTAELHKAARCFGLFANGILAAFAGVLHRPNWRTAGQNIKGISRIVSLPDWQGLGLAPILADCLGSAYKAAGWRLRAYPAHPALIRVADKSPNWRLIKKPGYIQKVNQQNVGDRKSKSMRTVSRPGAVFEFCGEAMEKEPARLLIETAPAV